eukprot:GSMAST32.ASY1.ANO1.2050.1 assembled CDS
MDLEGKLATEVEDVEPQLDVERNDELRKAALKDLRFDRKNSVAAERERIRKCKEYHDKLLEKCRSNRPAGLRGANVEEDLAGAFNDIGWMNERCPDCQAYLWADERNKDGTFSVCCSKGQVRIKQQYPPLKLVKLYSAANEKKEGKTYMRHIRQFNSCLSFASFCVHDESVCRSAGGVSDFRLQGQAYKLIGSLNAPEGKKPKFLQIYFTTSEDETKNFLEAGNLADDKRPLMIQLASIVKEENEIFKMFKWANDTFQQELGKVVGSLELRLTDSSRPSGAHERQYNLPVVEGEVAAIIAGIDSPSCDQREIRVRSVASDSCDRISSCHALYDPLTYPLLLPKGTCGWHIGMKKENCKSLTARHFAAYMLFQRDIRRDESGGRLYQQWIVDQWVKIEEGRLNYLRFNQKQIKAELYQELEEAIADGDAHNAGRRIVLPATHKGSPRDMTQRFADAMRIVGGIHSPDIFLTMTFGSTPPPDLCSRELTDDLYNNGILGEHYQKRGLPHAHILLILKDADRPKCVEDIDRLVCAEIPDPTISKNHARLHAIVDFPKDYCKETKMRDDSFPQYRRRKEEDGGIIAISRGRKITNQMIVPYNPFLSLKYNCHINVEVCTSISSVKYLFKYVYKGHDRIMYEVRASTTDDDSIRDEIKEYIDARYVSTSEATSRILSHPMYEMYPPVERLEVHAPNEQFVSYQENSDDEQENANAAAALFQAKRTQLTAFFFLNRGKLCKKNNPSANDLTYMELPRYYKYDRKEKNWIRRKSPKQKNILGRMRLIQPSAGPAYYVRLLLHNDDQEWSRVLEETAALKSGSQLRGLFVIILTALIEEDYMLALADLKNRLALFQKNNPSDYGLPEINEEILARFNNQPIYNNRMSCFNESQKPAFLEIKNAIDEENGGCFFLDAFGGIAAVLLEGGRTAHSTLKIPINACMCSALCLNAVDLFVVCGDWRQVLPIIPKGSRAQIIGATFKKSPLWKHFKTLKLNINERVARAVNSDWSNYLLSIGDVPDNIVLKNDKGEVNVDPIEKSKYYSTKAILTPKNVDVDLINLEVQKKINDFLNTLNISGLPSHEITLTVGSVCMLLRNLDPDSGMCNGSRFIVTHLGTNFIKGVLANGSKKGNTIIVPRITLIPNNTRFPFTLRRRQFPIRLAFAMTINKSQGQTLERVGIYLPKGVFAHGQMYVALSRCGKPPSDGKGVRLLCVNGCNHEGVYTKNIVYQEILN